MLDSPLVEVLPRTLRFSKVEVLLHSMVANFIIFFEGVLEGCFHCPVGYARLGHSGDAVIQEVIILVRGHLVLVLLHQSEIELVAVAHADFVVLGTLLAAWSGQLRIVVRNLLIQKVDALRDRKAFLLADTVLEIFEAVVVVGWPVLGDGWRAPAEEFDLVLREPTEASPRLE